MRRLTSLEKLNKFWNEVDYIMQVLYREFPLEMMAAENEAKYLREVKDTSMGYALENGKTDKSMAALGIVPSRFHYIFSRSYPKWDDTPYKNATDFWNAFFKRYTQFLIRDKV